MSSQATALRWYSRRSSWLTLVVIIVLLDQITKLLCDAGLDYAVPVTVMPGFDLLLVYNEGAAFSFLSDAGGWQRWVLGAISVGVSLVVLQWLLRVPPGQVLLGLALTFILGGALGNLIDRAYLGYVIDFISINAGDWRFATFNLADAAISCGAALLLLDVLVEWRKGSE